MTEAPANPKIGFKRIVLVTLAAVALHAAAAMASGMVLGALGVPTPKVASEQGASALLHLLAGSAIVCVGMAPLASALTGSRRRRMLALATFLYATNTFNTAVEASLFTVIGGGAFLALVGVLPAFAAAAVLARLGKEDRRSFAENLREHLASLRQHHVGTRVVLAWLAFPVVYFVFGMMVGPFVTPAYRAGIAGLILPPLGTIFAVQLGRSAIFLATVVPILIASRGSALTWRLGFAYFTLVGLSGLVSATFFPMLLRVAHSLEICADSFVYAALLVVLLGRRSPVVHAAPVAA